MIGSIPIEREGNTTSAIKRIKECLDDYIVIIFPEGARLRNGSMLPFKDGVSKIAIDTEKRFIQLKSLVDLKFFQEVKRELIFLTGKI